eukprot:gene14179-15658_t
MTVSHPRRDRSKSVTYNRVTQRRNSTQAQRRNSRKVISFKVSSPKQRRHNKISAASFHNSNNKKNKIMKNGKKGDKRPSSLRIGYNREDLKSLLAKYDGTQKMSEKRCDELKQILRETRSENSSNGTAEGRCDGNDKNVDQSSLGPTRRDKGMIDDKNTFDDDYIEMVALKGQTLPAAVLAVAKRMKESAFRRMREETRDKLETIMHRVAVALHHSGYDTQNEDQMTSQEITAYGIADYDAEGERQKRNIRQKVVQFVLDSIKNSNTKMELIGELEAWMSNLLCDQYSDERDSKLQENRMHETEEIHDNIISSISELQGSSDKLLDIARSILTTKFEACTTSDKPCEGVLKQKNEGSGAATSSNKIITAKELEERQNWKVASKKMMHDLEEIVKATQKEAKRKGIQHVSKQFKIFATAIENGCREMDGVEKQLAEKKVALEKALKASRYAEERLKSDAEVLQKLNNENCSMRSTLEDLKEQLKNTNETRPNQERKKKRRKSMVLLQPPSGTLLAKPNSIAAVHVKDDAVEKETANSEMSIIDQIRSRLDIWEAESDSKQSLESLRNNEDDSIVSLVGMSRREQLTREISSKEQEIYRLEDTVNGLRDELATARETIESQAVKIAELEGGAEGGEKYERRLEQMEAEMVKRERELDKSKLQYEKELENKRKIADDLRDSLNDVKNTLAIKDDQISHMQQKLNAMNTDAQKLLDERQSLEQRTVTVEIEGDFAKDQLLVKLKNQHALELQRLRDFIAKENQRNLAELRKNQTQHQNDINTIHKGSMQLIRTVNRFKDSIALILERESLSDAAHEMRSLVSLPTDAQFASSVETKMLLSKMAYQATELLVSCQAKLSKALLNKRIEVKEAATAKCLMSKDLESNLEKLRKSRWNGAIQTEKYKIVENAYTTLARDYQDLSSKHAALQKELAPYQQLIDSHAQLKMELENMQQEQFYAARRNTLQISEMEKDRAQLKRVVEDQRLIICKLGMTTQLPKSDETTVKNTVKKRQRFAPRAASTYVIAREDQKRNLHRLDEALATDRIDSTVHERTVTAINKAMDLPRLRLIHLVQRYVAHKKMEAITHVLRAAVVKYKNNIRLTRYVNRDMYDRIERARRKWEAKKTQLVEYRAAVFMQLMETMSTVKNETGLLLIEPLCKQQGQAAKKVSRNIPKKHNNKPALEPLTDPVVGKSMQTHNEKCMMWKQPDSAMDDKMATRVILPRIVDMDINRWKHTARSTLLADPNKIQEDDLSKQKMDKIKMAYAYKLTLPPIATLYPE